jgi:hypothetical protein
VKRLADREGPREVPIRVVTGLQKEGIQAGLAALIDGQGNVTERPTIVPASGNIHLITMVRENV